MTLKISEADLSRTVEGYLDTFHWRWAHIRPARVLRHGKEIYETPYSGHKGLLDYIAVRPPRLLFFELKSENGKLSLEQHGWFEDLEECSRTIIVQPLEIHGNKVDMKLNKKTEILTLPEVYLFYPSDLEPDGGKILEVLR